MIPGLHEWVPHSDRYAIRACIGAGGMGVVYRAYDRELGEEVALKTLRSAAPAVLFSLKEEFRSLSGIVHPNLVTLYDLEVTPEHRGFFTMELVEGTGFLEHVRPGAEGGGDALDEGRLRAALRQLADGIGALHAAGKLHCDIKPSNVMVTGDDRMVILDFGLVTEIDARSPHRRGVRLVAGSPAYMSPEQAVGAPLTAASDVYGLGALLYEALTGRPPFEGPAIDQLRAKQRGEPPHPSTVAPAAPRDLADLSARLLRRRPAGRPTVQELLEILGEAPSEWTATAFTPHPTRSFVGRSRELAVLGAAFDEVCAGRTATVFVYGVSGIGKSTLVARFLDDLEQRGRAIILRGRCYERESVPYKALDSIVDGLVHHLEHMAPGEVSLVLPPEAHLLARVFPALGRIGLASLGAPDVEWPGDPREVRRRAFAALGEMLRRLGQRAPLVLAVDDLQWGDIDSAALFTEIFWSLEPPLGLVVLSFRMEDRGTSPLLQMLLDPEKIASPARSAQAIEVGPLSVDETHALTRALLEERPGGSAALIGAVAQEAGGSPFFVHELVTYALSGGSTGDAANGSMLRFDEILAARLARLGDNARRLLEAVAVAGYPLEEQVATHAAGIEGGARSTIEALRASHLVLVRGAGRASLIEAYHDRIREAVVERISPEAQRGWHLDLAEAVLATPSPDPQRLVDHYLGAGLPERAAGFALAAGDRAASALAFNRAANLYRLAVDHGAGELWLRHAKLAEALSNAGRSAEAAGHFAHAAESLHAHEPTSPRALEWKRQASEEYLRSGLVDAGLRVLREVLREVGSRYPETTAEAVATVLLHRAELRVRRARPGAAPTEADRARLEAYWSAGLGLSMVDTTRAAVFQIRHQLLALRAGDPVHAARARATQAVFAASEGGTANRRRCVEMISEAEQLAERHGNPGLSGLVTLCSGVVAYFCNEWQAAVERCGVAERICRERGRGLAWEITNTQIYGLWGLAYLGWIPELARRVPLALREARERGDVFAATSLRLGLPNLVWLAADRPEEAHEQAADAMQIWTRAGFHSQHYFELVARAHVDIYRGDGWTAWRRIESTWPALQSAFLLRLQSLRVELLHLRARCALTAAAAGGGPGLDRRRLLSIAARDARRIALESAPLAAPLADCLTAGLAASSARTEDAIAALDRAARGFEGLRMSLHAQAVRIVSGALVGGDQGRDARGAAIGWMRAQGIVAPVRMAAMLVPGIPRSG